MTLFQNPTALALAWTLLHFLWQGALLGLLAWVGLTLLARRSPQVRYAWATALLGLMALAPAVTFLLLRQTPAPVAPLPAEVVAALPALPLSWGDRLQAGIQPWLPALTLGWLAGVALFALRLAGGLAMIQRLKGTGTSAVPAQWHLVLSRLCRDLKLHRPVRLLGSARVDVPTVVGWLRPVILLPASALTQLTPHQLEAILAHELAHVRRHDFAVNLLQACVEALLFYHPAVWWLSAKVREERELACDDVAVSLCGDALAYAQALAVLDDLRAPLPTLALASHGGSLMKRIARLIQPQLLPNPTLRSALLTALAATALGAAGLAYQDGPKVEKKRTVTVQSLGEGHTVSIKGEGDFQVKPDEKDPLVLAPGARMRIAEKKDGKSRKLDVTPEKKVYTVDGQEKPFDADAEAWLRETLKASEKAKAAAKARGEEAKHRRIEVEVQEDGSQRHVIRKENGEVVEDVLVEVPEVKVTEEGPGKQRLVIKKGGKVVEDKLIEHPDVQVIEGKDGARRIVVKKEGKVVSEEELPDVKVTHEKGQQHIVVKKGGKVVEDRIIEIPEVKVTDEADGTQRLIVKKGGKVVEDRRLPGAQARVMRFKTRAGDPVIVDSEGGPDFFWESDEGEGPRAFTWKTPRPGFHPMTPADVQQLRRQVDELKKQVAELQRQLGRPAAAPKAGKPAPAPAPAPTPAPAPKSGN